MVSAALALGTGAASSAARATGLYLGGLDVIAEPATPKRYAVPIESISVTEAGPDGVSSMSFTVADPLLQVTVQDGQDVRYHDHVRDVAVFLGFVESFRIEPAYGEQGRRIIVKAVGIEAVLDWAKTTSALTFAAGGFGPGFQIQAIVATAEGLGPIRALQNATAGGQSNQATPMTGDIGAFGFANPDAITISPGTTVREAIRAITAAYTTLSSAGSIYFATVDFTYGLRLWAGIDSQPVGSSVGQPTDYTTWTRTNTPAAPATATENLGHEIDAIGVVRGVFVIGTGVTTVIRDGSGRMGPVAVLSDPSLTTLSAAQNAGQAYLNQYGRATRGSFDQIDRAPQAGAHGGSLIAITDARTGGGTFRIAQIEKTFHKSGRETWRVTYGGAPASMAAAVRRLTRSTLS